MTSPGTCRACGATQAHMDDFNARTCDAGGPWLWADDGRTICRPCREEEDRYNQLKQDYEVMVKEDVEKVRAIIDGKVAAADADPYFSTKDPGPPGPTRPLLSDSAARWVCGTLVVLAVIGGAVAIGLRHPAVLPGLGLCFLVAMVLILFATIVHVVMVVARVGPPRPTGEPEGGGTGSPAAVRRSRRESGRDRP